MIRDHEVIFREPSTGQKWTLTPERVVQIQFQLGSDVVICLDDCTDAESPYDEQARKRGAHCRLGSANRATSSIDWPAPSRRQQATQALRRRAGRGIEQLRRDCAAELARIGFDGYGFGGWPLGPEGSLLTDALRWVVEGLPEQATEARLGIGRPDHVVSAFALGYSLFDCALPTRDARHGRLYAFRPGYPKRLPKPGSAFFRAIHILDARISDRPRTGGGRLRLPHVQQLQPRLPAPSLQGG